MYILEFLEEYYLSSSLLKGGFSLANRRSSSVLCVEPLSQLSMQLNFKRKKTSIFSGAGNWKCSSAEKQGTL